MKSKSALSFKITNAFPFDPEIPHLWEILLTAVSKYDYTAQCSIVFTANTKQLKKSII